MGTFTADSISSPQREPTRVEIPGEDDDVLVKRMTVADREKVELATKNPDISDNHGMALYVSLTVVDEQGKQLLTVQQARTMETELLDKFFAAALSVNSVKEGNE